MGFYLPGPEEFPNGSNVTIPSRDDCNKRIMGPLLVDLAANISSSQVGGILRQPLVNTATINVAAGGLPNFIDAPTGPQGIDDVGAPIDLGWTRWFVQAYG